MKKFILCLIVPLCLAVYTSCDDSEDSGYFILPPDRVTFDLAAPAGTVATEDSIFRIFIGADDGNGSMPSGADMVSQTLVKAPTGSASFSIRLNAGNYVTFLGFDVDGDITTTADSFTWPDTPPHTFSFPEVATITVGEDDWTP